MLTLYGALIVFALVALLPVALIARVPLKPFLRLVREPALIAFAKTSSAFASGSPRRLSGPDAIPPRFSWWA